jgi:hypothetical protein
VEINKGKTKFVNWSYFASMPGERRYLNFREGSEVPDKIVHTASSGSYKASFNSFLYFGNTVQVFNDIENHYAKEAITYLYRKNILRGESSHIFGATSPLSRGQMAVILGRLDLFSGRENLPAPSFSDVSAAHWAYESIKSAAAAGLMYGYPEGVFHPEAPLTRGEAAVIMVRAFNLRYGGDAAVFDDLNQSGFKYAAESIKIMASLGYTKGAAPGLFAPERALSRGETAVLLERILRDKESASVNYSD